MGNIKQSTIYIFILLTNKLVDIPAEQTNNIFFIINHLINFFIIIFLVTLSINKILAITLLLVALCILLGKNIYLRKIIKANKLYAGKNYSEALKLYRQTVNRKNIPGFIVNNYLIMELKYGDCTIAQNYINSLSLNNSKIKSADLLSIKISKSLVAWKNNKSDEAINYLKELLEESETTYLYETLTSLLIVNNKLDDALTIIDKGLNYNDSSNVLKSNFAEANYLLGNYNVAEVKFKELVDSNVSFMEPYYYLGLILLNNNENDAALEILKKATLFNDSLVSLVNCEKIKNLITSI